MSPPPALIIYLPSIYLSLPRPLLPPSRPPFFKLVSFILCYSPSLPLSSPFHLFPPYSPTAPNTSEYLYGFYDRIIQVMHVWPLLLLKQALLCGFIFIFHMGLIPLLPLGLICSGLAWLSRCQWPCRQLAVPITLSMSGRCELD